MNFIELATEVAEVVTAKNKAYGGSFAISGAFIELLWPGGVPVEAYPDMLSFVRTFDKMARIATDPTAFGEDPHADMVGYALLNLARKRKRAEPVAASATDTVLDTNVIDAEV